MNIPVLSGIISLSILEAIVLPVNPLEVNRVPTVNLSDCRVAWPANVGSVMQYGVFQKYRIIIIPLRN